MGIGGVKVGTPRGGVVKPSCVMVVPLTFGGQHSKRYAGFVRLSERNSRSLVIGPGRERNGRFSGLLVRPAIGLTPA